MKTPATLAVHKQLYWDQHVFCLRPPSESSRNRSQITINKAAVVTVYPNFVQSPQQCEFLTHNHQKPRKERMRCNVSKCVQVTFLFIRKDKWWNLHVIALIVVLGYGKNHMLSPPTNSGCSCLPIYDTWCLSELIHITGNNTSPSGQIKYKKWLLQ